MVTPIYKTELNIELRIAFFLRMEVMYRKPLFFIAEMEVI